MPRVASRNCIEKLIKINFRRGQTVRKITPDPNEAFDDAGISKKLQCTPLYAWPKSRSEYPGATPPLRFRRICRTVSDLIGDLSSWAIYAVLIVLVIGFTRRFRIDHQGADQISGES